MQEAPYRLVPVKRGDETLYAKVDPDDYEWAMRHNWFAMAKGYAGRNTWKDRKTRRIGMHRELLGLDFGDPRQADHWNRDKLDNRKANLRIVTRAQNVGNQGSRPGSISRFRGVYLATNGRWYTQAKVSGQRLTFGTFDREEDAARAVNAFWVERGQPAPNPV